MKEPFYFSLSFKKIYYTQASILHSLSKRSLSIYTGSFLEQERQRCMLTMDLQSSLRLKKQIIDRSKVLAQFSQQSTNRHILKYPIQLIEMSLKNVYQLDFCIPNFDPSCYQQFIIVVKGHKENGEIVEIGNLVIDPNVFITLYKQQNMSYYEVNQRLYKQGKDSNNETERKVVDVVLTYQLGIAKSRFALQKALYQNKKGINIAEFRQTLRKFHLMRKDQEQQQDYILPNQSINKMQQNQAQQFDVNKPIPQIQYKIQVISPMNQKINDHQIVQTEYKIQFEERTIMEKAANKLSTTNSAQSKIIQHSEQQHKQEQTNSKPLSLAQKFKNYLRKKIQPQLKYINPVRQNTQQYFNEYYKETSELKQIQQSLVKQTNFNNQSQRKVKVKVKACSPSPNKESKMQEKSSLRQTKITNASVVQKGKEEKKLQHFPHHKKAGSWFQRGVQSLAQNSFFKIKIIIFVIFSIFLINFAMTPSRKVRPQIQYVTQYQQNPQSFYQN